MIFPGTEPISISRAAEAIKRGELVAFPTETVYGLGADAFNAEAVRKIYLAKGRPTTNPLIVHIAELSELYKVTDSNLSDTIKNRIGAIKKFWPGPLSVVLPANRSIPTEVRAGLPTVAVRIPDHPVALSLIRASGTPIAAPSANPSLYVSPTTAQHVSDGLGNSVSIILDGGPSKVGLESTIISLVGERPVLLRAGAVTVAELENALGPIEINLGKATEDAAQQAPGSLRVHYSPHTPLTIRKEGENKQYSGRVGLISFGKGINSKDPSEFAVINELSVTGDLEEVASRLFAALREQDKLGLDLIVVDSCEPTGIGLAIMDRLERAQSRFNER